MTRVYPAGMALPSSPGDWRDRWMAYREEIEEEQRLEEERRQRLEALPPEYVIHIVHGTFARKATWIEPDSEFCTRLRNSFDWRAKIEPFHWSGKNGALARWQGAQALEHHLRESIRAFPHAHHIAIAHSHGGNIVLWALHDSSLARKILGVVTLSTPFLSARVRPSKEHLIDFGTALFAGFFIFFAVLFFSVFRGLGFGLWPWAAGIGLAVPAAIISGGVASEWMRKYAQRIRNRMPATALTSEQVAIVRVEGDEATAAITGVRLAGALGDLLWRTLSAPVYKTLEGLLTTFDYVGVRSATERDIAAANKRLSDWLAVVAEAKESDMKGQLSLSLSTGPSPPPSADITSRNSPLDRFLVEPWLTSEGMHKGTSWTTILRQVAVEILPAVLLYLLRDAGAIGRQVALALGLIYGLPAALAVATVVLGLPFGVLSAITLLPCGWTLPFAGPFLQLVAEPCPSGSWKVTQFEAGEEQSGLLHSEAYQRCDVSNFVAWWIKDRRKTFEARA